MAMLSDKELLDKFRRDIEESLASQRANGWFDEMLMAFGLYDGSAQWDKKRANAFRGEEIVPLTLNMFSPAIDSICGFEVANRTEVTFQARTLDDGAQGKVDVIDATAKYILSDTGAGFENSQAFRDMTVCGVGATDTYISYDENIAGEFEIERVFPGFLLWDASARRKNFIDRNWNARISIKTQEIINSIIAEKRRETGNNNLPMYSITQADTRLFEFYKSVLTSKGLGIMYEYQWRERAPFYQVRNILMPYLQLPAVQEVAAMVVERYPNFDPAKDLHISIEPEELNEFRTVFESLGLPLPFKATKQKKFRYYRALITGNVVIEKEELFTQQGFTIQFMTGKFDERQQRPYGLARAAMDAQRIYNEAYSDLHSFIRNAPRYGMILDARAFSDVKAFIKNMRKGKEALVFDGGEHGVDIDKAMRERTVPPLPNGLMEVIANGPSLIIQVMGVTPDFLGQMTSSDMSGVLYDQRVTQGLMTLAPFFEARKQYIQAQGRIIIDGVGVLVENQPGRLIRNVTGEGSAKYFELTQDKIANEYDIIINETPSTQNQKMQMLERLVQVGQVLGDPEAVAGMLLPFTPLDKQQQKTVTDTIARKSQPIPPDPVNQELLAAEAAYKRAAAAKYDADSRQIDVDNLTKVAALPLADEQAKADLQKTLSEIVLNYSKAGSAASIQQPGALYDGTY